MSPAPFDWSLITKVKDTPSIPPDVVFQIVENGKVHEVTAHKMILAMISPVFEKMFYTTDVGDKTAQQIKVEQTTEPAFQVMIDAVYNSKPIEDSLNGKSVREVFDVVNLIERFQIAQLVEVILKQLSNYPITDETVMDVADEAMQYTSLFPKETQHLLLVCAKFLQIKLKDAKSICKYAEGLEEDRKEAFATLLGVMSGITAAKECSNCNSENCLNGMEVRVNEFREGLGVFNNIDCGYWRDSDCHIGRIRRVDAKEVQVEDVLPGLYFFCPKTFSNKSTFLFSCNEVEDISMD